MAGYATPAWVNDASPAIDDSALLDIGHGIEIAEHPYGVCSTAAATAAKTVTIDYSGTLTLFTGLTVRVKFTNGNSAASPTLNVNSTGDKAIVYGTAFAAGGGWTAGAVTELTYDGTNWVMSRADAVDTNPTSGSTNLITSDAVFKTYQRTCNPNLLDNWYFIGGGSQQGGGQFPINQRGHQNGQTSYTGNTYGIDRWNGEVGYSIVTVSAGGVNVKTSSAGHNGGIVQNINNPTSLLGKEITASVLYDNTFLSSTVTVPSSFSTSTFAATAPYQLGMTSGGVIYIRLKDSTTTGKTYKAVKIELGSTQTLCHNEGTDANPVWVLNEIPNYGEQYERCITSKADSYDTYANKTLITNTTLNASGHYFSPLGTYTIPINTNNYVYWISLYRNNQQTYGFYYAYQSRVEKIASTSPVPWTLTSNGTTLTVTTTDDYVFAQILQLPRA